MNFGFDLCCLLCVCCVVFYSSVEECCDETDVAVQPGNFANGCNPIFSGRFADGGEFLESHEILNVYHLLAADLVAQYMRFEFASQYFSID